MDNVIYKIVASAKIVSIAGGMWILREQFHGFELNSVAMDCNEIEFHLVDATYEITV